MPGLVPAQESSKTNAAEAAAASKHRFPLEGLAELPLEPALSWSHGRQGVSDSHCRFSFSFTTLLMSYDIITTVETTFSKERKGQSNL